MTTKGDCGAVTSRPGYEAVDAVNVISMNIRPDLGLLIAWIPLPNLQGPLGELLGEFGSDTCMHEQSSTCKANLAGVVVLLERQSRSEIKVSVVKDDGRALATKLEGAGREVIGGGVCDQFRGRHGSSE